MLIGVPLNLAERNEYTGCYDCAEPVRDVECVSAKVWSKEGVVDDVEDTEHRERECDP